MNHEAAVNALQKQRMELLSKKEQFLSEIDAEINRLENSIEVLSGKRVWETESKTLYDDDSPNSLSPSYEVLGDGMGSLNVLIGFEESQASCIEFRNLGHNAFSCDLKECSGGKPEFHLKMDIFKAIKLKKWDLIILHAPCTYTALCGNRWYWNSPLRIEGIKLCKDSFETACSVCDKVVLEQPKTIMQRYIGKRSQTIHPWQFGHGETKETWLWIKGLPELQPTEIVEGRENKIWKMPPSPDRQELRSKTYPGIAAAFAVQWGGNAIA